jgi:hypothetical protein
MAKWRVPVTVRHSLPRRTEKATSPTAALARARPWTSSVTVVPWIDTTLSPLINRSEAAQPSATSVTTTCALQESFLASSRSLLVLERRLGVRLGLV